MPLPPSFARDSWRGRILVRFCCFGRRLPLGVLVAFGELDFVEEVVESEVSGSQGMINVAIGVNADLTCNGISIISSSETSGLGSKANDDFFKDQFPGLSADQAKVTKDGGSVEAITGATITSKAVCTAVRDAIAAVETLG